MAETSKGKSSSRVGDSVRRQLIQQRRGETTDSEDEDEERFRQNGNKFSIERDDLEGRSKVNRKSSNKSKKVSEIHSDDYVELSESDFEDFGVQPIESEITFKNKTDKKQTTVSQKEKQKGERSDTSSPGSKSAKRYKKRRSHKKKYRDYTTTDDDSSYETESRKRKKRRKHHKRSKKHRRHGSSSTDSSSDSTDSENDRMIKIVSQVVEKLNLTKKKGKKPEYYPDTSPTPFNDAPCGIMGNDNDPIIKSPSEPTIYTPALNKGDGKADGAFHVWQLVITNHINSSSKKSN